MSAALITGTSRGIGRAALREFAQNGWNVIAHARKRSEEHESACAELAAANGIAVTPVYFDMLDTAGMKACVRDLKKNRITVDALVNNAGVSHGALFQMTPVSAIKAVFDVNLFAHMELTQLVLKLMGPDASIVNVASVAGTDFRGGNSAYGVSKAALIAWTKVLAAELRGKVRVNAVAPGLTDTDMAREMEDKLQAITLSRGVLERLAKPGEIAKAIYYLAAGAPFITGQVLKADGGGGI